LKFWNFDLTIDDRVFDGDVGFQVGSGGVSFVSADVSIRASACGDIGYGVVYVDEGVGLSVIHLVTLVWQLVLAVV
jgi:hypothetical protein